LGGGKYVLAFKGRGNGSNLNRGGSLKVVGVEPRLQGGREREFLKIGDQSRHVSCGFREPRFQGGLQAEPDCRHAPAEVASFYLRKLRTENVPETDQSAFQLGEECLLTRNRPTLFTAFRHTADGLSHFWRHSWRIPMLWSHRSQKGATNSDIVRTSLQFPKTLYPAPALCGSKAVASSQGSRAFPIKGARNLLSRTNFRSREATGRETHRYTL